MKPVTKHPGLILLLLLLLIAAASIPASAAPYSGDIPDTPFRWTLNDTGKSLDIFPVFPRTGSLDLTPDVISEIGFTNSLQPKDIRKLTLSNAITGIKADTFKDFTGLSNLYFKKGDADVSPSAFPFGKVYKITAAEDIANINTIWAIPGEEIEFTYSAVIPEGKEQESLLQIDSEKTVSISADYTINPPFFSFKMPANPVGLRVIREEPGKTDSGGTTISYLTCRATVSADPGIRFTVNVKRYNEDGTLNPLQVEAVNDIVSVILEGDERVSVTITSYPAGSSLSVESVGVEHYIWTGTTYSVESYPADDDWDGEVKIHIKSTSSPQPTGGGGGGGGFNPSVIIPVVEPTAVPTAVPTVVPITPPSDEPEFAVEGVLIEGENSKVTVTDVTDKYPGIDTAEISVNVNTAIPVAVSGADALKAYLLSENPYLSGEAVDEITAILMNAIEKGIVQKTVNTEDYLVNVSGGKSFIEFYRTYDIVPEAGNEHLREVYFSVPLEDLKAKGFTDKDVIMYHGYPDDKIWIPLDTWLIGTDSTAAHYIAYTNGASPFAIVFAKDAALHFPWHLVIAAAAAFVIILGGYITYCVIRKRKEKQKKADDELGGNP